MVASTARIARAVLLLTAVLLMQCSNVIVEARLLEGGGAGLWLRLRQGAGPLIMQVLSKGNGAPPGTGNQCWQDPNHPGSPGSCN